MKLVNKLAKLAGKKNFEIDKEINARYLIRICQKYFFMKVRGLIRALFYKNIKNDIYIGKRVKLICKNKMNFDKKVKIHDNVLIDAMSKDGVIIGENSVIGQNTIIECTGSLKKIGKGLTIGKNTSFSNDCFFGAAGGIEIGNDTIAGQYVRFHSENHNFNDLNILIKNQGETHKGIKVGNNCWIGSGAVFLDGAKIGNGCVVAANAVITKEFPDNVIIGGIPAKIIKNRGEN